MSILIIDGKPGSQSKLIQALQPLFLSVTASGTTQEAIQQVTRDRDDLSLILLDLDSSKIDAIEILQELQENTINAAIPVIALSSTVDSDVVHHAIRFGARHFIAKPYCSEVFLERVSSILQLPIAT
ncbi:MAG: response regulator [Planctomycetota bacterium]|jgi:CheY-like chemotaxis protein